MSMTANMGGQEEKPSRVTWKLISKIPSALESRSL